MTAGLGRPASGIGYNVTNLGIRTPVGLNNAGQVALNQSTSFGYADPYPYGAIRAHGTPASRPSLTPSSTIPMVRTPEG